MYSKTALVALLLSLSSLFQTTSADSISVLDEILLKDDFDSTSIQTTIWTKFGEGTASFSDGVLSLFNSYVSTGDPGWEDYELKFQARAPAEAEDVQIFASIRHQSDMWKYSIGLRGGNNNDLFIARYFKTNNNVRILKIEPLDFVLEKNTWYTVRIVILNNRISVFLGDEQVPRATVADHGTPLTGGGIALGGGWNPVEFDNVEVKAAEDFNFPADSVLYNFQDLSMPSVDGWRTSDGSEFLNSTFTMKNENPTGDHLYDTALGLNLGRTKFRQDIPNGDYLISLQMGWNNEKVQSIIFFQDDEFATVSTIVDEGDSVLIRRSVSVTNGQLVLEFLRNDGYSSYINWMAIVRRQDVVDPVWNFYSFIPGDKATEKRFARHDQRRSFSGISISSLSSARSIHSLNGDWLFLPSQEHTGGPQPWHPQADDSNWHIMEVPNFWTPLYAWNYLDVDQGKGSANWVKRETARCEKYTFDYETTTVAFYRQYVTLPSDISEHTSFLAFDAIGKDAEVWINGEPAGVHAGLFTTSRFDITNLLRPGVNVITVKAGDFTSFDITNPSIAGVAEREPIGNKGLKSYPNGMLFGKNLGIWQGVSLTISGEVFIEDTFFKPGLNSFNLEVTLVNKSESSRRFSLASQIRSYDDNRIIYDNYHSSRQADITIELGSEQKIILNDSGDHEPFRNWSPEFPNLYKIDIFTYRYNENPDVVLTEFSSPVLKLNFQPEGSATPLGWTAFGGGVYQREIGFGWNTIQDTRERISLSNSPIDPLLATLVTLHRNSEAVFTCDVPNGDYVLSLQFGDPDFPTLVEAHVGDDTYNMDNIIVRDAVDKNVAIIVIKSLTVENEKLRITFPSMPDPAIGTSLNWLVLEPRSAVTTAKWELGLNHFDILDHESYDVGFRTFNVQGDEFHLNGYPYKIRGANHCPNILRPNDAALADWFTKKMHEKNINFSRSHGVPMNDIWLKAANENGVAISQEGTWPWLMHSGDTNKIPPPELLRLWQREWLSMVKKHKNHPSILMWTMNNESKLFLKNEEEPWRILSEAILALREVDPTRPIVADSGYVRRSVETMGGLPSGVDDGDVDDIHEYFNWYDDKTVFRIRDGETFTELKSPGRPFISQELSTGYPDADTGHPTKNYLYTHMNPQAWVGRWAYEDKDPQYFLERHALITKETAEAIRTSYRKSSAGAMMFSLNSWFKDVYDVNTITPWPTLEAVSLAHEPVMACIHLNGRHFYTGAQETLKAYVINDSAERKTVNNPVVEWQIMHNESILLDGILSFTDINIPYFESMSFNLSFSLPASIPDIKISAILQLKLYDDGGFISFNQYKILICDKNFATPSRSLSIGYYGDDNDKLVSIMQSKGIEVTTFDFLDQLLSRSWDVVVIGKLQERPQGYERLISFISEGGHVLFHENGKFVVDLFPNEIYDYRSNAAESVTPVDFGRRVFSGIGPTDLSWFTGSENLAGSSKPGFVPYAASGKYNVYYNENVLLLVEATDIHGYKQNDVDQDIFQAVGVEGSEQEVDKYWPDKTYDEIHGYPLLSVRKGSGVAIVSSMLFEADMDPIANKLLVNVLEYLVYMKEQTIITASDLSIIPKSSLRAPTISKKPSEGGRQLVVVS